MLAGGLREEEGWVAALWAVYMNCSVRDLDSFMFWPDVSPKRPGLGCTDLCPELEDVLEGHARVGELSLEHHDDVAVVFVDHLCLGRGCIARMLLDMGLESCNLLVEACNVLLDDEGEFLETEGVKSGPEQVLKTRTLISTGRSSNRVLRFATGLG